MINTRRGAFALLALTVAGNALAQQLGPTPPTTAPSGQASPAPQNAQAPAQAPAVIPPLPAGVSSKPGVGLTPEEFGRLANTQMPLNPNQVRQLNKMSTDIQKARAQRATPAPKPVSVTARVSLAPGAAPAIVRLDVDTVTSLVFNDVTGAPWRVLEVRVGGKGLVDIPNAEQLGKVASNMFTITPLEEHVSTNLAVFLEGAPAPVTIIVATGQKEVDFRVDVSIQARGPAAVMPVISRGLAESVSPELTSMVSGITPATARALRIVSSDVPEVTAWVIGERMYVRSRANVLAPAVPKDGKVATGPDGTKVYELPHAPEVLLMAGGQVGRLRLAGFPPPTLAQIAK